jgi:acyl dehydratase
MNLLAEKLFTLEDQERFASASGDWNPMHMDSLAARRTQMGAPVVHGIHAVLTCLEVFAQKAGKNTIVPKAIKVNFLKPIYLEDLVRFSIVRENPLSLAGEVEGVKVLTMDLAGEPGSGQVALEGPSQKTEEKKTPKEQSFADIEKSSGVIYEMAMLPKPQELFPETACWLGGSTIDALASLSRIVGMECPGLHSIFLSFTVNLSGQTPDHQMRFSVLSVDDRFNRVKLNVCGGGLAGTIDAVVRTPPVRQASLREIAAQVKPGSFTGQRVLVVGGSRGIGEYVAKVIAAGGGHVTLTYTVGQKEAQALLEEIRAFGGQGEIMPYDVKLPALEQVQKLKETPTHVYYFATGAIFRRRVKEYDPLLYEKFHRFYVSGFYELCAALHQRNPEFSVFYPSSVAVVPEERPRGLVEYAMAKAAGEVLCSEMRWLLKGVNVTMKRLPRLPTDQTVTYMTVGGENTMDMVLAMVQEMQNPAKTEK